MIGLATRGYLAPVIVHLANYLDSQYIELFFSLSLQHNDIAHLLPLFGTAVCKSIAIYSERGPFLHKVIMLASSMYGSLLQIHPLSSFMIAQKQTVDDQSVKI